MYWWDRKFWNPFFLFVWKNVARSSVPWSEIIDILHPLYMRFCFSDLNLIWSRWLRNSFETLFRIVKLKKLHTYLSYNLKHFDFQANLQQKHWNVQNHLPVESKQRGFLNMKETTKELETELFPCVPSKNQLLSMEIWTSEPEDFQK